MGITYDAPSNTITVTGFSAETPCTFLDIWNADQGGGWGVVSKQGTAQFMFDCKLKIGDGSTETWFADTKKQITWNDIDTSSYERIIEVKSNAHFIMGTVINESEKATKDGVQFVTFLDHTTPSWHQPAVFISYNYNSNVDLKLYSCSFSSAVGTSGTVWMAGGQDHRLWNCILDNFGVEGGDVFNVMLLDADGVKYARGTYEKIYAYDNSRLVYTHFDYPFEFKDVYGRNNTIIATLASAWSGIGKIINSDLDVWSFYWDPAATGKIYRQYEFDTHCQDKEGGDLTGVSAVGEYVSPYGQAFSQTTDGNGDIPTQTVDHGFFDQAHGDTEQLKTPLKVTYSKPGYQTIVKYYDMIEKTKDVVVLHKAVRVFEASKPVINLKRTDPENKKVLVL